LLQNGRGIHQMPREFINSYFDQDGDSYDDFMRLGAVEWLAYLDSAGLDLVDAPTTPTPPWGNGDTFEHAQRLPDVGNLRIHANHSLAYVSISIEV
jgi:hypothetical protein